MPTLGDVQQTIVTAIGGMEITRSLEGRERYPIRVAYSRELRDSVESLISTHEEHAGQCDGQTINLVLSRHQRDLVSGRNMTSPSL